MKKLMFSLLLGIFLISFASATSIGTFQQNTDVELYQTCNNCTYCNLTSVKQQATTLLTNVEMTKSGTYFYYNLNSENTTTIGKYSYCYDCGNNAESRTGCIEFEITPSGNSGTSNLVFIIILITIFYFVGFIGFFGKNTWVSILGGFGMMALGIYIVQIGLIIFRDWFTNAFAYITIGLGAIFSLVAIIEFIQENM